jgi:hypothetical protein
LLVAPPGDADTLVLRAATGELLGTRRIVSFEKRMTTIGRQVLTWESEPGGFAVRLRDPWDDKIAWSHSFAAGAKAALAGQDALGVLEPDGDFVLIKLADGKPLVTERLEPEGTLAGITLTADDDRYLLITNSGLRNEQNLNVQPLPNSGNSPFVNGRLYAFSVETGKSAWPAPVVIAQYGMLAAQPKNLPVLVFVRQVSKPGALPNRENHTSVLCIDKRSGRVAYENDQLPAPTLLGAELVGDGVTHTISLTVGAKTIELQFTDEAIESPPGAAQLPGSRSVGLVRLEPMTRAKSPSRE